MVLNIEYHWTWWYGETIWLLMHKHNKSFQMLLFSDLQQNHYWFKTKTQIPCKRLFHLLAECPEICQALQIRPKLYGIDKTPVLTTLLDTFPQMSQVVEVFVCLAANFCLWANVRNFFFFCSLVTSTTGKALSSSMTEGGTIDGVSSPESWSFKKSLNMCWIKFCIMRSPIATYLGQ